jgi:hypothetical protein
VDIRAVRITDKVIRKEEFPILEPARLPIRSEDDLVRDESA